MGSLIQRVESALLARQRYIDSTLELRRCGIDGWALLKSALLPLSPVAILS